MSRRRRHFGWGVCGLVCGLLAVSVVSCTMRRAASRDDYVGPRRSAGGARASAPAIAGNETLPPAGPAKAAVAPGAAAGEANPATAETPKAPETPSAAAIPPGPPPAKPALRPLVDHPLEWWEAELMALENNQGLVVERIRPEIARTREDEAMAAFDPRLTGMLGKLYDKGSRVNGGGNMFDYTRDSLIGEAGVAKLFPSGTNVAAGVSTSVIDQATDRPIVPDTVEQVVQSRIGLTVTQALLQGFGSEVNLARIREARIDALASEYQLRGFAELMISEVEQAYWDCMLAKLQAEIVAEAAAVAEQRLEITRKRIAAGTLSETERWAAEASLARREEERIDARSGIDRAKLRLLRLMNPQGGSFWDFDFEIGPPPTVPFDKVRKDVESYVKDALRMRPDLNEARLMARRGELEVVRTRNGLLPRLDLFVTLGKSGYADSFSGSWHEIGGSRYDLLFGVRTEYPVANHAAQAQHKRAQLSQRSAEEAIRNLEQLVQEDVRGAFVEFGRAEAQIRATQATLQRRKETWIAEQKRQDIGQSTEFQVARAHSNYVDSRNSHAQAVVDYCKALVDLYRLTGTLLVQRGIEAPGGAPVGPGPIGP